MMPEATVERIFQNDGFVDDRESFFKRLIYWKYLSIGKGNKCRQRGQGLSIPC